MLNIDSEHIENLVFSACEPYRIFTEININAPRLKYLEIQDCKPTVRKGYCHIKIGAPNISGIKFDGLMFRDYSLLNMHSLVDACIDTNHTFEDNYKALEKCLVHLLDGVRTTESLTISMYAFQACSKLQETMEALPISFTNLKHLRLTGLYNKGHVKALANFLVKCSYIEELVLEISQEKEHPEDMLEADWGQELTVERSFDKLQSVEIRRLEGCLNEIQLLNFLLKNAPELKRITLIKGEALRNDQVKMDIFLQCLQSLMFDHADEEWDIR